MSASTPSANGDSRPVPPAVACDDVCIAHRSAGGRWERRVDGVTFTLARGQALGLFGTAGSGMSSLLRVLAGEGDRRLRVDGGGARVGGIPVRRSGRDHRRLTYAVGFLGRDATATLPSRLTAGEIIGSPVTGRDRNVGRRALALRVASLLDELGLSLGVADRYPYELSAGMCQRVGLARALMLQPAVLAVDGLFAHVDVRARRAVTDAVQRRRHAYGMAVLSAGNDTASARLFDSQVVVLHRGHTAAVGRSIDTVRWVPDAPQALRRLLMP